MVHKPFFWPLKCILKLKFRTRQNYWCRKEKWKQCYHHDITCCPGSMTGILVVTYWSTQRKFGQAVFWFSNCQSSSSSFLLPPFSELQIYSCSYQPTCSYMFLLCNTYISCSSVIDPLPIVDQKVVLRRVGQDWAWHLPRCSQHRSSSLLDRCLAAARAMSGHLHSTFNETQQLKSVLTMGNLPGGVKGIVLVVTALL